MSALYGVGVIAGFVGHRNYTFSHKGDVKWAGRRYAIAHCLGYLINITIQVAMVDRLGYPHQLVQAISMCVVAAFLFAAFRYFVFANAPQRNASEL